MNRIITATASLTLLATTLTAQAVYAPDNLPTTGSCNGFPLNETESRYQTIINARYLPQRPVKITSIGFAPCSSSRFSAQQMQIRMCHTTLNDFGRATVFDRNLTPAATEIVNGPRGWGAIAGQWSPFISPCHFGYDGQRNLLIEIRFRGAANGVTCRRGSVLPRLWANGRGAYAATAGSTDSAGLKIQLRYTDDCVMNAADTVTLGQALNLNVTNAPAGQNIQVAASLGQKPTTFGGTTLCLTGDLVFIASVQVGGPVFNGYAGRTNRVGNYQARFVPPVIRSLVGVKVYHAAVTYNRTILCGTNTVGTLITS